MITDFSQRFDSIINLIAAAAVIFYAVYMNFSEKNNGLRKRLLFLLSLLGILCLTRGINYLMDFGPAVEIFILVIASIIPLALFLLVELMLRRHLPLIAKLYTVCATLFLVIAFLIFGINQYVLIALMGNYIIMLLSIVFILFTTKNLELQKDESNLIRIAMTIMILIVPLIVTDFKKALNLETIRYGAFGILFFMYALVKVWERVDVKGGISRLVYLLCFNLSSAALICYLFDLHHMYMNVFVIFIMLRMFSDILIYTSDSYNTKAQDFALRVMEVFLEGNLKVATIKSKIQNDEFVLLSKKDLFHYSPERIQTVFKESGLYFKNETNQLTNKDVDVKEEILHIYEDFDCNACIFVKILGNDFFLILFKWPDIAPQSKLKKEILLIQGLASQIKE